MYTRYDETVVPFRYCIMHRLLSHTHFMRWGSPWTWERWVRRDKPEGNRPDSCVHACAACARGSSQD